MFPEQLKKILNLIKKTGDRVVIFDGSNPDNSYVIMDFDKYAGAPINIENSVSSVVVEKIELSPDSPKNSNLTEEDLTDKINREISTWKNREVSSFLGEENKAKGAWQIPPKIKDKAQEVE